MTSAPVAAASAKFSGDMPPARMTRAPAAFNSATRPQSAIRPEPPLTPLGETPSTRTASATVALGAPSRAHVSKPSFFSAAAVSALKFP